MTPRWTFAVFALLSFQITAAANEIFTLAGEPLIRIGLSTNSSSVSITTGDSSLVAYSPDEPLRMLASNRVSVAARSYRPPEIEQYRFEIQNLPTADEANNIAKDIREATGETALVSIDPATNTWRVWVGAVIDTVEEADKFKQAVADAKLTPPAEKLDAKHQALLDDLQKKDGTAFDTAYVKAQHDGHVETVAMFEAYAKGGDNARMKQFANDMLPTLKAHLDQVSKLK